jgi:hypothetical protein
MVRGEERIRRVNEMIRIRTFFSAFSAADGTGAGGFPVLLLLSTLGTSATMGTVSGFSLLGGMTGIEWFGDLINTRQTYTHTSPKNGRTSI